MADVDTSEMMLIGRGVYRRCETCNERVKLNKKIFGSFHICSGRELDETIGQVQSRIISDAYYKGEMKSWMEKNYENT